jgi:hypothetical protein
MTVEESAALVPAGVRRSSIMDSPAQISPYISLQGVLGNMSAMLACLQQQASQARTSSSEAPVPVPALEGEKPKVAPSMEDRLTTSPRKVVT